MHFKESLLKMGLIKVVHLSRFLLEQLINPKGDFYDDGNLGRPINLNEANDGEW